VFLLIGIGMPLVPPPATAATTTVATASRTEIPVDPDREEARQWADRELSGAEYREVRPGPVVRFLNWLLAKLQLPEESERPKSPWISLAVGILGLIILVIALRKIRPDLTRTVTRKNEPVFAGTALTAADHRAAADRAAEAEDWSTAVLERFRCLVRELEERSVLQPLPGRTADETTEAAASRLPELATRLRTASTTFDAVRYGNLPAHAETDQHLRELDERIRRARVTVGTVPDTAALVPPA
jgi:hypothetical protein